VSELPSCFADLESVDRHSALRFFEEGSVPPGELLMHHTYEAGCVAYVVSGEVEIHLGDAVVGRAGAGEWVGESALFPHATRTATVYAATPCSILALTTESYVAMRKGEHRIIPPLERDILTQQLQRMRRAGDRIVAHGQSPEPAPPGPGFFARVATQFGPGGTFAAADVDVEHELRVHGIADEEEPDKVVARVAKHFEPQAWAPGGLLCREGAPGKEMFVLIDGTVDVVRSVDGGQVEHLATLEPGDALGIAALHEDRPRMASCVAASRCTVLRLDADGWATLANDDGPAGSCFRRAMIRVLADQLAATNLALADVAGERSRLVAARAAYEGAHR